MPGVVSNPGTDDVGESTEASQAQVGGKEVYFSPCFFYGDKHIILSYIIYHIIYHILSHHIWRQANHIPTRSGDGHISTTAFEWKFEQHIDGNCLECDWNVDGV